MAIDKSSMSSLIYDPTAMQQLILSELDSATKGEYSVVDPTNPFTLALESAVTCAAASVQETVNLIRKQYPNLATTNEDLFHHVTENESTYMFATPAEMKMRFFVNTIDLRMNGVKNSTGEYVEAIIPSGTSITALDVTVTTLNDILVRLYSNNDLFIEQQLDSSNDIAYEDISLLNGDFVTDSGGTSWIVFETYVKQITKHTVNKAIVKSAGFTQQVNLSDKFCHAIVSYKGSNSSSYVVLNKMFNDEYIDPLTPGVVVKIYDSIALFKIPDQYLLEGSISGNVKIEIFMTKGKQYLPLNKYNVNDFSYVLGDTTKNAKCAASKNIAMKMVGSSILEGGTDGMDVSTLRQTIIDNTTGDIELPITEKQLERLGEINGYTIIKATDIITQREFLGLKSVPEFSSNLIFANHTIFFNTAKILLSELENCSGIIINSSNFVIKSNTIFKNNNSVFTPMSNEELEYLSKLKDYVKIEYLKANKLFYNPFYYIVEKSEEFVNSRVYDLDNPEVLKVMIKEKNITLEERANVKNYSIKKVDGGYRLSVNLNTNTKLSKIDIKNIFLQMRIPLYSGNTYAYINSTYEKIKDLDVFHFDIKSNMSITQDGLIDLKNGISSLSTKEFNLTSEVLIYICTTDVAVKDPTLFLQDEINFSGKHVSVLTKELFKIRFGQELTYIYNNLYNVHSERLYKTHKEDIPMVYEEDVYEINAETGCIVDVVLEGGKYVPKFNILHHRGDVVLDESGNPVLKYKKGDTVVDEHGNPVIDLDGGIIRHIDMLMLEYEFFASKNNAYNNYSKLVVDTIKTYILEELEEMNNKLLEKTSIKYKSYNTTNNISIMVNNTSKYIGNSCSPRVELYVQNTGAINNETKDSYRVIIGNVFNTHFTKSRIVLEDIKSDIKAKLGNIVASVKITNVDTDNSEVIIVNDKDNRMYLNKSVTLNKNNELITIYDIEIEITYI